MLSLAILLVPILGAVLVGLSSTLDARSVRIAALATTGINLLLSLILTLLVRSTGEVVAAAPKAWSSGFGTAFRLEADGLSALLVLLTNGLGVVAVIAAWSEIRERVAAFHVWLLILITGILTVFLSRDLILFYFGYELMLIPAFFLISLWSRDTLSQSALRFFIFTFTGSIFVLAAFLYVYFIHGQQTGTYTFGLKELASNTILTQREQWWIFLGLLIGFAVKIPLVPLHQWLPDTYTQAPNSVALMLSGIMSKTGVFGLMVFAMPLAPEGALAFGTLLKFLALFGIIYGAFASYGQRNFKKLVAYSSIAHLGFVVLGVAVGHGLPARGSLGYQGAVLQMFNHGLAVAALFLIAGMLARRADNLSLDMFGGLWRQMPTLGGFLLFFSFASLGLPGTGSFIGELYVVAGAFRQSAFLGAIAAFGVMLAATYSLKLFLSTMHGPETTAVRHAKDTTTGENWLLGTLAAGLVVTGLFPAVITRPLLAAEPQTPPFRSNVQAIPVATITASPVTPRAIALGAAAAARPSAADAPTTTTTADEESSR